MNVGDRVMFLVDGDGERLIGRVVEVGVTNVDGWDLVDEDLPCVYVQIDDGGCWAVPELWIVGQFFSCESKIGEKL